MSDRQTYYLAAGVWFAAFWGARLPGVQLFSTSRVAVVLCVLSLGASLWAWRKHSVVFFIISVSLFCFFRASLNAEPALVDEREYEGWATLVSDPKPSPGGVEFLLKVEGRTYRVRSWGSPAGWVRHKLSGEQIHVRAKLRPLTSAALWVKAAGIEGRATLTRVDGYRNGKINTRISNWVRRKVEHAAASMSRDDRALYTGLVYGDDRFQSDLARDEFDAAGLAHLVAVSGQNIVFVMAIAGPVLRRCSFLWRFVLIIFILAVFATMTRFEPSIVRASAMSSVAAFTAFIGAELSPKRAMAIALTGLICYEPLIVQKIGFQLSVAASIGIMFWAKRFALILPGPRVLAESVAITGAAQLSVSPLLLYYFGPIPVGSLPANLLAGPAAGPVMMWGLTGGVVSAWLPEAVTKYLVWVPLVGVKWIRLISRTAAKLHLGNLGWVHVTCIALLGFIALRAMPGVKRNIALICIIAVLTQPVLWLRHNGAQSVALRTDSALIIDNEESVLWLDSGHDPQSVLAAVRESNLKRVDLIVFQRSSYAAARLIKDLRTRIEIGTVLSPKADLGVGEIEVEEPSPVTVTLSEVTLQVTNTGSGLELHVKETRRLDEHRAGRRGD